MQRRKGKVWEREVARLFRDAMPGTDPHRGQQCRDGSDASDVEGVPGFWIEAKHQASPHPEAALRQAQEACRDATRRPIAVLKRNHGEPFVCLSLADFLVLIGELHSLRAADHLVREQGAGPAHVPEGTRVAPGIEVDAQPERTEKHDRDVIGAVGDHGVGAHGQRIGRVECRLRQEADGRLTIGADLSKM